MGPDVLWLVRKLGSLADSDWIIDFAAYRTL